MLCLEGVYVPDMGSYLPLQCLLLHELAGYGRAFGDDSDLCRQL